MIIELFSSKANYCCFVIIHSIMLIFVSEPFTKNRIDYCTVDYNKTTVIAFIDGAMWESLQNILNGLWESPENILN